MGKLWYRMCSCQPTLEKAFGYMKNKITVIKSSCPQLVDNCTYGTIAFPCIKNSLDEGQKNKAQVVLAYTFSTPVKTGTGLVLI